MKLEINKKHAEDEVAKYFATWTRQEFKRFIHNVQNGRIKKDGYFYKRDYENYQGWIKVMYNNLAARFEIDIMEAIDERDTALRVLKTLSAEQFKSFANITFEPYANLEDNVEIIFDA